MTGEFLAGLLIGTIIFFVVGLICGVMALSALLKNPEGTSDEVADRKTARAE